MKFIQQPLSDRTCIFCDHSLVALTQWVSFPAAGDSSRPVLATPPHPCPGPLVRSRPQDETSEASPGQRKKAVEGLGKQTFPQTLEMLKHLVMAQSGSPLRLRGDEMWCFVTSTVVCFSFPQKTPLQRRWCAASVTRPTRTRSAGTSTAARTATACRVRPSAPPSAAPLCPARSPSTWKGVAAQYAQVSEPLSCHLLSCKSKMNLEQTQEPLPPIREFVRPKHCVSPAAVSLYKDMGGGGTEDPDQQGEGLILRSLNISASQVSRV